MIKIKKILNEAGLTAEDNRLKAKLQDALESMKHDLLLEWIHKIGATNIKENGYIYRFNLGRHLIKITDQSDRMIIAELEKYSVGLTEINKGYIDYGQDDVFPAISKLTKHIIDKILFFAD